MIAVQINLLESQTETQHYDAERAETTGLISCDLFDHPCFK
jgi:hypothetical protein